MGGLQNPPWNELDEGTKQAIKDTVELMSRSKKMAHHDDHDLYPLPNHQDCCVAACYLTDHKDDLDANKQGTLHALWVVKGHCLSHEECHGPNFSRATAQAQDAEKELVDALAPLAQQGQHAQPQQGVGAPDWGRILNLVLTVLERFLVK